MTTCTHTSSNFGESFGNLQCLLTFRQHCGFFAETFLKCRVWSGATACKSYWSQKLASIEPRKGLSKIMATGAISLRRSLGPSRVPPGPEARPAGGTRKRRPGPASRRSSGTSRRRYAASCLVCESHDHFCFPFPLF